MADKNMIKETLNLPRTSFSMKAKLAQKEPEIIKKWEETGVYRSILKNRKGSPVFVLHDGPPYANGNIHLGTALNKILKDFIIKTKSLEGYLAPYVPGWDCHGLPIEIKVDQQIGGRKKEMSITGFREECRRYALKFVEIQREQFKRLGVFGAWEQPYLTLNPGYEGEVIRHLADFFEKKQVYKGKKPVYWCTHCETALAEAEIEYKNRCSPSIYVKFPVISDLAKKYPQLKGKKTNILIWTTTPWTLPANLAIAFHPDYEYSAVEVNEEVFIAAKRLIPVIMEELNWEKPKTLVTFSGREMEGLKARHPFVERESLFVLADYVTLDQGTGCVHTAPGHGQEDYLTGRKYGLDIFTPVDEKGCFTPDIVKYGGMNVFEANPLIVEDLKNDNRLIQAEDIEHSYPHCWRCKKPVIFRATSQWFIAMDINDFRSRTLESVKKVNWIPHWGEQRISKKLEARPDWCIPRQRSWGVPIPAFSCRKCQYTAADHSIARHVADIFSREGADAWFLKEPEELLPPNTACPKCGSSSFDKENNILDVWFESGASHNVLDRHKDLTWPADIYIEGHDQYRGWFNSSLLIGVAVKGTSPFKTCITHGFVLDEKGKGMSKSLGNFIEPEEIISKNGAEILRLWVAMLNFKEDARFGKEILQRLVEAYRKIRNTWRFILGNIYDFNPDQDSIAPDSLEPFDAWIMEKCARLNKKIIAAYQRFDYHVVFHTLYNFFTVTLSSYYLDVLKDRLYCSAPASKARRSAQTALFQLLRTTLILMSPVLPFTTEEAWEAMPEYPEKQKSVHLERFIEFTEEWMDEHVFLKWDRLAEIREIVLKSLEEARETKTIGNSLEAKVKLEASGEDYSLLSEYEEKLPALFIVSEVELISGKGKGVSAGISRVEWEKCRRCWNHSPSVGKSSEYPEFCERCDRVVKQIR
ncbi:MAG: isoleucine--tRNA ligase [Candidatus Aminicenantaceae bacterium]